MKHEPWNLELSGDRRPKVQMIFLLVEASDVNRRRKREPWNLELETEVFMTYKPTGRKSGGQPGNTNALKHGIYSHHISVQDDEEAEAMAADLNNDELTFARIRLKDCIIKQQSAPPEEWLSYEKAIAHYISKIVSMIHHNAILGSDKKTGFVTVLEMIRQINEEQNAK